MTMLDNQHDTLAFLAAPGHLDGSAAVERRDTHASVVFLTTQHAYKLKRAVCFDYLDYSTAEKRRLACEAELEVNRRTAADLYLRVAAITKQPDGSLGLDGVGPPVDWLVVMRRFDDRQLFDALAEREALPLSSMPALADTVHAFHATAERTVSLGGHRNMSWVVDSNDADFAQLAGILDRRQTVELTRLCREALERHAEVLERRREGGWVRHCHGDLHLANVVMLDGRPRLFDAIEFNEAIACVDVWYDVAFLLMDLMRRGLTGHAHALFQRYADRHDDLEGVALLPFFMACRAAVRAKTTATAVLTQPGAAAPLTALAQQYLALAITVLTAVKPVLLALGGLSGSGKSTVAAGLAPHVGPVPGALVLSSDVIRKQLAGVARDSRLPADAYTASASCRVYGELVARASVLLAAGHSVIVEAVHARAEDRAAIAAATERAKAPFLGVWLEVAPEEQEARVRSRPAGDSDATVAVLAAQRSQPVGDVSWLRIDASAPLATVVATILSALLPPGRYRGAS